MHDCNHLPFLGTDYTTSGDYGDVGDAVVVDALYVNLASCFGNDANICSSYATIGAMVNKYTWSGCVCS
jgi:hypothetical protein